jgi:hypothetical protein
MLRKESLGSTVNGPQSSDKSILHLKDLQCQSADAGQSGFAWPVSPSARPVPTASGKQRPLRKNVVERFAALTRERRERRNQ